MITPPGSTFKAIKSAVEKADQTLKDVTEGGTCEGVWNQQAETGPLDDQPPGPTKWNPGVMRPSRNSTGRPKDFLRRRAPDDGVTTDDDPVVFKRSQVQNKLLYSPPYSPPGPGPKKR